nr:hypothetical protein [Tanacetum cinerariifolium]
MSLLTTLMETCASLSQKVAELEPDKLTQALEILKLKKRVKKLERKKRSKYLGFKRLRTQEKDDLERAKVLQKQYEDKEENIDWNAVVDQVQERHLDNIRKYQNLKKKPVSIAQARKNMIIFLKNMAGYKMEHSRGMTYDKVRPIFEREYKKVQTLFKPDKDVEESKKKKVAKETLLQESFKKLKAVEVSNSKSTQETPSNDPKEMSEEDVQNMLEIIPVSEFKVEVLQVKYPIIDWEIHSEGSRTYWKIIRVGGITEAYQSFEDMLKGFDKEDLVSLWSLVREKFSSIVPSVDKEKALWVKQKRLFKPDADDVLWKLQRYMYYLITWKLYTNRGVHQVSSTTRRHDKFMLIEKDYPLSNGVMTLMLSAKLKVEEDSEMARDLVMKIFMEANKPNSRSLDTSSKRLIITVSYKLMLFGLTKDAAVKLMLLGHKLMLLRVYFMDFLNAHVIQYALMVNPTIYVSRIKQFWASTTIKKVNDVVQLRALIDRKKIFAKLARMGYEKPPLKLTFYKTFFSVKWMFLIHTLVQCVSAKRTSWNEFSCSMASAVICLAIGVKVVKKVAKSDLDSDSSIMLRPNGEALRKCILSSPYKPTTVLVHAVEATDDSPAVPEHTTVETPTNMSPENKAHFLAEKEAIHLILTRIGDDIYLTVDACQTAQEMWEAIERCVTIVKQQRKLDEVSYHKLFDILKQYQNEVNELRAEKLAKNANPLALVATAQASQDQFYKTPRVKDSAYHKEKMLLCKQAEQGVPLQAEQYDWLADTDKEVDEQELEAHYSYMAKIQEVSTADSGTDLEPVDNVTPNSPDMCEDDIQNEQNDVESDDERVTLANLIDN